MVRSDAGAFFHVRVGMPRMSRSSISNSCPGAVRVALASAMETDGGSFSGRHVVAAWPAWVPG